MQQVGAVNTATAKLADDDVLNRDAYQQTLAGLSQGRYALGPAEADVQARNFFAAWEA